jgi:ABC-type transport system involved in cytochrome c biogenesis permease subunit
MDETAIQTGVTQPDTAATAITATPPAEVPLPSLKVERRPPSLIVKALSVVASLRLTVIGLVLGLLVIFFGTLALMDEGLYSALHNYFRCFIAWVPFQLFVRFGHIFLNVDQKFSVPGGFYFPGGWLIGAVLLVNVLAAHAVRFKLSMNRAGILILHAGLIVMMLGELVTGVFATENRMMIWTGGSSNYLESHNKMELAVIDKSDPKTDDVVAIPQRFLKDGQTIHNDALPFDIEVVKYMVNSTPPAAVRPGQANLATAGDGLTQAVQQAAPVSGTNSEEEERPSAYIALKEKSTGKALGTYLVSVYFSHPLLPQQPQQVTVGGKTYDLFLRNERNYKPFTFHLKEFHHDLYEGTNTPKNYSSLVRLVDPANKEDREVNIYMNNPLRYEGETFYQSGVLPDDKGTILQVVRNPGWEMPYISCLLVTVGMLWHFGIKLSSFLGVKLQQTAKVVAAQPLGPPFARFFPWLVTGLACLYLLVAMTPAKDAEEAFHLREFGRLPVMHDGRIKPFDTLARDSLMVISGRQTWRDASGKERPAIEWLLDVMLSLIQKERSPAMEHAVFRIDNIEVLDLLGLQARSGYRYAPAEFAGKIQALELKANETRQITANRRTVFQQKVSEVAEHVQLYIQLASLLQSGKLVPPATPGGEWQLLPESLRQETETGKREGPAHALAGMIGAYGQDLPADFNKELKAYREYVGKQVPESKLATSSFEYSLNAFEPYYQCMILYVIVFLMASISWLGFWSVPLRRAAFMLAGLTVVLHTGVLIARMYLMGRWGVFVVNLYSTAVFIGWVCMLIALVMELIFKEGIATAVAGLLGFVTAFISNYLARTGDTLGNLQAVLDTNFWLATHVTSINIGYAATALAGTLAMFYLLINAAKPNWEPEARKSWSQMIYGVLCFATLFSFVGTVLGGLWADKSWGRFWGWDPKENGAMMIVLMNAIILHARWAGMVKQQGMAVLAVVGNMVTAWSWFGTNQLGAGLHAYGFNPTLATGLRIFWLSQLAVIAVGLMPWDKWRRVPAAS